jgi:formate dehydrogenase major subunit
MIHADANVPLGESSCVSCGTCVQLCPTGALFNKRSAFMGRDAQTQKIKSTCSQCSIGCGMEIVTRGGNVLRVESDWEAEVNNGLLCIHGRFEPLYDQRVRICEPMIRRDGKLEKISWPDAIQTLAKQVGSTSASEIGVLASSNATNEALYLLNRLFLNELKVTNAGILNKITPQYFAGTKGLLADISDADVILLVCADPLLEQPVAAYLVKRAVDRGARLIVVNDQETGLTPFTFMNLGINDLQKAVEIAERAEHPLILYGSGITQPAVNILKKLEGKASFLPLEPGVNTRAAEVLQLNNGFNPSTARLLYILLGEQNYDSSALLKEIPKKAFVVVQASYVSDLTGKADLVLPAAIWPERAGSITNTEGRVQKVNQAVTPQGEAKADWEALSLLADKLGKKIDVSINKVSAHLEKLFK